jgi:4-hydroxy-3-polyprenylbenzoate decarboxylase
MGSMRIIVGITGASGALYALELLRHLSAGRHEVHVVVSGYGWKLLEHECGIGKGDIATLSSYLHDNENLGACIASGSFRAEAMIIVPCSMRTLAAVAAGLADNLICRAADVMIKERKNLVLAVRETPLSAVHLENMLKLARLGVGIMPLSPAFYHNPQSIAELATALAGRIMDNLAIPNEVYKRWQGY